MECTGKWGVLVTRIHGGQGAWGTKHSPLSTTAFQCSILTASLQHAFLLHALTLHALQHASPLRDSTKATRSISCAALLARPVFTPAHQHFGLAVRREEWSVTGETDTEEHEGYNCWRSLLGCMQWHQPGLSDCKRASHVSPGISTCGHWHDRHSGHPHEGTA